MRTPHAPSVAKNRMRRSLARHGLAGTKVRMAETLALNNSLLQHFEKPETIADGPEYIAVFTEPNFAVFALG
jgi:hypothetical protein